MKIKLISEAKNDLKNMPKNHQEIVLEKLTELEDRPVGHKNTKLIHIKGYQLFRYKIKSSRGDKDYRAVYDIEDGYVKVVAVFHRDEGYNKDSLDSRL